MSFQTPNQPTAESLFGAVPEPTLDSNLDRIPLRERLKNEDGRVSVKLTAIGVVAVGLVGYGVYQGVGDWLHDQLPNQVASPEDSEMNAATLAIKPTSFDCRSFTAYDHDGSTARTKYEIASIDLDFTGYGAVMKEGKSVMQACAPEAEISVEDTVVDGQTVKEVSIPTDSLRFQIAFNEADTKVVRSDPALSQFGGGLIDMGSALGEGACSFITFGQAKDQCEAINVLSRWNSDNQAELERSLRVAVLKETQAECAPLEWNSQKAAITDSYRQQAVDQGFDPYTVNVRFVDDSGKMTADVPDFTKSALEELYQDGVLEEESDDTDVEFSGVHCTPLEGGYQAKYPNKTSE